MELSFVIPTFNSIRFIKQCLDAILQQYNSAQICVIDNGSTDSTPEFISRNYPSVTLIKNTENKGSSFARNQGMRLAKGEFIIFIDSDCYLSPDFLKRLFPLLSSFDNQCAGIAPKIISVASGRIFSCGLQITPIYRVHDIGRGKKAAAMSGPMRVPGVNSCCTILKRSALEKIEIDGKYFDEDFFFLFEDVDLSLRLKKKGYQFQYLPELTCFHYGKGAEINKEKRRFLSFRNRLFIIAKNEKSMARFFLRSFIYDIPRSLHFFLTNRCFSIILKDVSEKRKREKAADF